jgi:hypothetical protein
MKLNRDDENLKKQWRLLLPVFQKQGTYSLHYTRVFI